MVVRRRTVVRGRNARLCRNGRAGPKSPCGVRIVLQDEVAPLGSSRPHRVALPTKARCLARSAPLRRFMPGQTLEERLHTARHRAPPTVPLCTLAVVWQRVRPV